MKSINLYHRFRINLYWKFKIIENFGFLTMYNNHFTSNDILNEEWR